MILLSLNKRQVLRLLRFYRIHLLILQRRNLSASPNLQDLNLAEHQRITAISLNSRSSNIPSQIIPLCRLIMEFQQSRIWSNSRIPEFEEFGLNRESVDLIGNYSNKVKIPIKSRTGIMCSKTKNNQFFRDLGLGARQQHDSLHTVTDPIHEATQPFDVRVTSYTTGGNLSN